MSSISVNQDTVPGIIADILVTAHAIGPNELVMNREHRKVMAFTMRWIVTGNEVLKSSTDSLVKFIFLYAILPRNEVFLPPESDCLPDDAGNVTSRVKEEPDGILLTGVHIGIHQV